MTNIKITELGDIGTDIAFNSIVPIVDMVGTFITKKANLQIVGNLILSGAGGSSFVPAATAILSQSVTNAAQPNITSVGTLTTLNVTGNVSVGNIIGNGQALTEIAGANVSGFVPNANVANTAFAVAAANVSGLGNIATINLTGSTSNVLYGNGVFAPASGGGGNVSALVNGDNSFALQSDGNVVLSGSEGGVNRGLVWDYGAVANGVNSEVRQDINGLSVRAWTEAGGPGALYTAPVNIVTNQDANTNTWRFDGQGNLTVPGNINAINDGGDLGAYLTLNPDLGQARIAGRSLESTVNYTSTSWATATYTSEQVNFTNTPDLVNFFNTSQFNVGVNQTISINGAEPAIYQGYSISGNDVIVYTNVVADPDPTTVTSIDFYYQLESSVGIDCNDGTLNINSTGLTINIDNDQTSGPDINIRSGDDILLQGKNKNIGSESEGGDINILAGNGADSDDLGSFSSTGGDIQLTAGQGGDGNTSSGSSGGFTQIRGGRGGDAGVADLAGAGGYVEIVGGDGGFNNGNTALGAIGGSVSIFGGDTTHEGFNGADVNLTSGAGGPNAFAGSVNISTPSSDSGPGGLWQFDGTGNLVLAGGSSVIQSIASSSLDPVNPNVSTMVFTPSSTYPSQSLVLDPTAPGHIHLRASAFSNIDEPAANIFLGGENTSFEVTQGANNQARIHSGGNTWTFGSDGNLTLPGNTLSINFANNAAAFGNLVEWTAVPVANTSAGTTGQAAYDAGGNLYVCIATDTWTKFLGTTSW